MEYKKVLKFLQIVGSIFIILSLLEIAFIILLNFTPFILDGNSLLLSEFIYSSTIFPLNGTVLWLFLIISMCCYLIVGIFMFKRSLKDDIESIPLAKFIVVIGMVVLLGAFIKMNYLVLLGKTDITTPFTTINFQTALYDMDITSIIPAIFWVSFMTVNTYYLLIGLTITAVGIKYTLQQEQSKKS